MKTARTNARDLEMNLTHLDTQDVTMPLSSNSIGWAVSENTVPYSPAVRAMENRAANIAKGRDCELIWLLEHDDLYTAGTSAPPQHLIDPERLPVHSSGRGGKYTFHGRGQRIIYIMLDMRKRGKNIRAFVSALENWICQTLADLDVTATADRQQIGLWVERPEGGADKIAAIGLRIRNWISMHGVSINLDPNLSHYDGIVPCGINRSDRGVTSLAALGTNADMPTLDAALMRHCMKRFGPIHTETAPLT